MRVLLITADGLRHDYVAARLAAETTVVGVVRERRTHAADALVGLSGGDRTVVEAHLSARDATERLMLHVPHVDTRPGGLDVFETSHGGANSADAAGWIAERRPDVLVLFGSSIIGLPLLEAYRDRVVNLHLGLSPYYRGSATNFWPLVHGEPECVGATIHLAVTRVDAGSILAQARPEAVTTDRSHEIGTRALIAGVALLPRAVGEYVRGNLPPRTQDLSQGRVFRTRDFTADAVRTMWRNFELGMMNDYAANVETRQGRFPIAKFEVPC
jgi:folate-dependent phosphoribosylglycinamide formyltransferase PurN